jgi:hypothetical protein
MARVFAVLLVFASLACASSGANLQRESARQIGEGLAPDAVKVSDVKRGASSVTWVATTPSGAVYDCSSDDMMRRPYCAKRKVK